VARKCEDQADAAIEVLERAQARVEKLERRARKKERKHKKSAKPKAAKLLLPPVQTPLPKA
jgi:molecular chaperone GrpE (heat shock protein)